MDSQVKFLRLRNDLIERIQQRADRENRSFSNMVSTILLESVDKAQELDNVVQYCKVMLEQKRPAVHEQSDRSKYQVGRDVGAFYAYKEILDGMWNGFFKNSKEVSDGETT